MCVLCVQEMDVYLEQLKDPSTDGERRSGLEWWVQGYKDSTQSLKAGIHYTDALLEKESRALSSEQGEPLGWMTADSGCHGSNAIPWQACCHGTSA